MLLRNFPSLPGSRQRFFSSRCKFSALTSTPDCTAVDSKPCVRNCSREREGLYNGNVQQKNPLCAASCVTKDIPASPRFSPTFFYPDANSVLLRAHLCSAVDSKPCVRNCSREREGLYNENVRRSQHCTGKESATPGCKQNKQADAGSRLFSKAFFVRHVVVLIVYRQSAEVSLHMYNGNVQ